MEAYEIFESLKRTSAYKDSAPESIKREILTSFWNEEADLLSRQYGPAGERMGVREVEFGFGFLMEGLAKHSSFIHQNTEKGQRIENLILSAMHTGDDNLVGIAHRRSNPDMLWIKCRGRRVEIIGMGEVKTSAEAFLKKPDQILLQEKSVRDLVKNIQQNKKNGYTHGIFQKYGLSICEEFRKTLIVPFGSGNSVQQHLPNEWEALEIEFSYDEIVFIAQKLWPGFRRDVIFKEGILGKFEKEFVDQLLAYKIPRLRFVYKKVGDQTFPAAEIVMFSYATKRLPESEEGIFLIGELMASWKEHIFTYPSKLLSESELTDEEKELRNLFSNMSFDGDKPSHIMIFLTNLRKLKNKLEKQLKNKMLRGQIELMEKQEAYL